MALVYSRKMFGWVWKNFWKSKPSKGGNG